MPAHSNHQGHNHHQQHHPITHEQRHHSPSKNDGPADNNKVVNDATHSVFSDYSHIGVNDLAFAIGLRLGKEDPEKLISKILPLSKIIPGEVKKREIKVLPAITQSDPNKLCMKDECVARRQAYKDLHSANEALKNEVKMLDEKIVIAQETLIEKEKSNSKLEDRNQRLRKEIEEVLSRKKIIDDQVNQVSQNNNNLRMRVNEIKLEVEKQKLISEEVSDRLNDALEFKNGPSVASIIHSSTKKTKRFTKEVSKLPDYNDSDSGEEDWR